MSEVIGAKDGEISCPNPKCIGSNHFCHDMCPKGVAVRNSSGGRAGVYKDFVSSRKKTRFWFFENLDVMILSYYIKNQNHVGYQYNEYFGSSNM